MNIDIVDFLPFYPSVSASSFNYNIYRKQEFYENRLDGKLENDVVSDEVLLKHQRVVSRFISTHTPYRGIFLFHEMGTGKTCAALGAAEAMLKKENSPFKRAVVLTSGENLLRSHQNDLVNTCTRDVYVPDIPPGYENDKKYKRLQMTKILNKYYSFRTFLKMAKEVSRVSDEYIIEYYSNTIFVIDEVHNLREKEKDEDNTEFNVYDSINRLLHTAKNIKVIVMSGTPMRDRPEEIVYAMNLIKPKNEYMSPSEFRELFMEKIEVDDADGSDNEEVYEVNESTTEPLKKYFQGYVSYLRAKPEVDVVYEGQRVYKNENLNIFIDEMDSDQTESYLHFYRNEKEKRGVWIQPRLASLCSFIFVDETTGERIFVNPKDVLESKGKSSKGRGGLKLGGGDPYAEYKIRESIKLLVSGRNNEERLAKLTKYSAIYANTIKDILYNSDNQTVFVYNGFVRKTGCIFFAKLLEMYGFTRANTTDVLSFKSEKKPRYILLTTQMSTAQIEEAVQALNQPKNMHGEYIKVVIGSSLISEGLTFKNVQRVHIQSTIIPWNLTEMLQAMSRAVRLRAHQDLINNGETPTVRVFLHAAVPKNNNYAESIDLHAYYIAEMKDKAIKTIERVVKESAVDCALFYQRNRIQGKDDMRECEYQSCDYDCNNVKKSDIVNGLDQKVIDYNTYNLYYIDKVVNNLLTVLEAAFRSRFFMRYDDIKVYVNVSDFLLLAALNKIIYSNYEITNRYGFKNYLREDRNVYFLTENMSAQSIFALTYAENPRLQYKVEYSDALTRFYISELNETSVSRIPIASLKAITIMAFRDNITNMRDILLKTVVKTDREGNIILNDKYKLAPNSDVWTEEKVVSDVRSRTTIGYYGIYNKETSVLKLVNVSNTDQQTQAITDKRKLNTGKAATSWKKNELAGIIVALKLRLPPDEARISDILTFFDKNQINYTDLSDDDKQRVYYWLNRFKPELIQAIFEKLSEMDLIE